MSKLVALCLWFPSAMKGEGQRLFLFCASVCSDGKYSLKGLHNPECLSNKDVQRVTLRFG